MNLQEAFDAGFEAVKAYVDEGFTQFEKRIAALELRDLPKGEKGEPGQNGKDGNSVTVADVAPLILAEVEKAVAAIPVPKDGAPGKDGIDGKDGKDGINGEKGEDGQAGRDGRDGLPGLPGEKGKDGVDGKDGRDGFSLEDFNVETIDDGRTIVLSFARGDEKLVREIKTGTVLDRGVWKEGTFEKGDAVTWGGSLWIAQKDTDSKPDTPDSGWRLAVKRGRDGKNGKDGERGLQGLPGAPGRDGYR